jgi:hypothetical protein
MAGETAVFAENPLQCDFVHLNGDRTRATVVGSLGPTTWAVARSGMLFLGYKCISEHNISNTRCVGQESVGLKQKRAFFFVQTRTLCSIIIIIIIIIITDMDMKFRIHTYFISVITWTIYSRFMCDYRRVMDWWMDSLTIYTFHSELQIITALSLISTLYKSLHAKSPPARSVFTSRCLVTALNSGDSAFVLTSLLSGEYPATEL